MRTLRSPIFIVCCLLFVIHQILQKGFQVSLPYIDQYLDSLLAMPIILTLLLWERKYIFKRGNTYQLSIAEIIIATLFIAFISEIIFPALSDDFTSDWLDVLCYLLGSMIYLFFIQRKRARPKEN